MIELLSSWELQGRLKLSDVLFVKEVQLDHQCCNVGDTSCDLVVDVSNEPTSKSVILQPYLHPEVSSAGPCCIMVRLSTQRPLRIIQLVLISSSSHIDFVDRYGEPLTRIEGVPMPDSGSLFRCSSGRLSPHTECVVKFSAVHQLDSLVIQYMGVYTAYFASALSDFTESESHTQEIIKLASFLGSSPCQPLTSNRSDPQINYRRSSKLTTKPISSLEQQHGKCVSCPGVISTGKDSTKGELPLDTLCSQFLVSLHGSQQALEFWQKCAAFLFTSLAEIASERQMGDFFRHMQDLFEVAPTKQQVQQEVKGIGQKERHEQKLQSSLLSHSGLPSSSTSTSALPHPSHSLDYSVFVSICALSERLNEIRQAVTVRLDDILKRLACLEEGKKGD